MKKSIFGCLMASACVISAISCSFIAKTAIAEKIALETEETSDQSVETFSEEPSEPFYTLDSGEVLALNWAIACGDSPRSFQELAERADVIVFGEPTESIEESEVFPQRGYDSFSITDFKVEGALKGTFQAGDTLQLAQNAAIISNSDFEFPDNAESPPEIEFSKERYLYISTAETYRPVRKGAKYVLFLNEGLAEATGAYFTVGMEGGRYNVDGTDELNYNDLEQEKMRDYAIALYQATVESPNHNPLIEIIKISREASATGAEGAQIQ